jgi:hypothetical protein
VKDSEKPLLPAYNIFTAVKDSVKPLLPAYNIFTAVKDSENPCCQPTTFLQQ